MRAAGFPGRQPTELAFGFQSFGSRMRESRSTVLCGGRNEIRVPTATDCVVALAMQ